jgi:Spy/CpxP family protein refolding chaperone
MMKLRVYVSCAFLLFTCRAAWAQQPPTDPIGDNLFPPELLMQHQQAVGLNEEQKNFIKGEVQKAQARFNELQWQLQNEVETMASLVKELRTDEQQVLDQLDKILSIEREIKRTHFTLIVRIKNRLTPEQQARLREIKNRLRER